MSDAEVKAFWDSLGLGSRKATPPRRRRVILRVATVGVPGAPLYRLSRHEGLGTVSVALPPPGKVAVSVISNDRGYYRAKFVGDFGCPEKGVAAGGGGLVTVAVDCDGDVRRHRDG